MLPISSQGSAGPGPQSPEGGAVTSPTHPEGPWKAEARQDAMDTGPPARSTGHRITPPVPGPAGADVRSGAAACGACSSLTFFRKAIRGRWRCPWSSRVTVMMPGRAERAVRAGGAAAPAGRTWLRPPAARHHRLSLPGAVPAPRVVTNQRPLSHAHLHEGVGRRPIGEHAGAGEWLEWAWLEWAWQAGNAVSFM